MKPLALREIVEERKEKAIETLSDSYANNRLPLEEYERLVEYINKIESERELVVVEKIVAEYNVEDTAEKPARYDDDDTDNEPVIFNRQLSNNLTVLSSRNLTGPLKSGAQFVSILGSTQIKVRIADLGKKRTVLNVVSFLGDNTIFVEPGIRVTAKAMPIMGSVEVSQKVERMAESGEPELVISGAALLGNISVKLLKE